LGYGVNNLVASVAANCSKNVNLKGGCRALEVLITLSQHGLKDRVSKLLAGEPDRDMQQDSVLWLAQLLWVVRQEEHPVAQGAVRLLG